MSYNDAMKIYAATGALTHLPVNKKTSILLASSQENNHKKKKIKNTSIDFLKDKREKSHGTSLQPRNIDLDYYFEIQRREHVAAAVIQRFWKKSRRLLPWKFAVRQMLSIVKIQKHIRGYLTRKFVARWYDVRNRVIVELQSRTRKYLSNIHVRPKQHSEQLATVQLQRVVRGRLGRLRAKRILRQLAATRIQCLWRGTIERSKTDRIWLNQQVIIIQNNIRQKLAKKKFWFLSSRYNNAIIKIQRLYRTYRASQTIGRYLHEREMNYRYDVIKQLSAEEELFSEKITRLMNRVIKQQIKENTISALSVITTKEDEIFRKENDLIELRRQREILSPRAVERGFFEDLSKQIELTHDEIANLKVFSLFTLYPALHSAERVFENAVADLEELAATRNHFSQWRVDEYDERRHINYQRDINERRKTKRIAIAEEKRKWQIRFYTKDGKPDKRRRPGKPWDKSIYAGAEKATYSSTAGVDLLAFVREKTKDANDPTKPKPTPLESTQETLNKVTLQTYLDQVKTYEQLLNPISSILQRHMGLLPTASSVNCIVNGGIVDGEQGRIIPPEEKGWGPIGKELPGALRGIGVEPPPNLDTVKSRKAILKKGEKKQKSADFPPITLDPGSTTTSTSTFDAVEKAVGASAVADVSLLQKIANSRSLPGQHSDEGSGGDFISPSGLYTAEELRNSLRRYWKKPPKPYLPPVDSEAFSSLDYGKYDYNYYYLDNDEDNSGGYSSSSSLKNKNKKKNSSKKKKTITFSQTISSLESVSSVEELPNSNRIVLRKNTQLSSLDRSSISSPVDRGSVSSPMSALTSPMLSPLRPPPPRRLPQQPQHLQQQQQQPSQRLESHSVKSSRPKGKFSDLMGSIDIGSSTSEGISSPYAPSLLGSPSFTGSFEGGIGEDGSFLTEIERKKLENLQKRRDQHQRHREKKLEKQTSILSGRTSIIPWELLDEADGALAKFQNEKAHVEFYKKF
jgi:hypothetical protein